MDRANLGYTAGPALTFGLGYSAFKIDVAQPGRQGGKCEEE